MTQVYGIDKDSNSLSKSCHKFFIDDKREYLACIYLNEKLLYGTNKKLQNNCINNHIIQRLHNSIYIYNNNILSTKH